MRTLGFTRQKSRDPALIFEEVNLLVEPTGQSRERSTVEMGESGGKQFIDDRGLGCSVS